MRDKRVNIAHSKIVNYWKDKAITSDGKIVLEKDAVLKNSEPVISDIGEPECWACGKPIDSVYELKTYEKLLADNPEKIWDYAKVKSTLNRCHIYPKCAGGSEEPSNMFLLCECCHIESPDTANPQNFFKWVYSSKKKPRPLNGFNIQELLRDFNQDCNEKSKNPFTAKPKDMQVFTHGGKISQSSIVYALADTCDNY